MAVAFNSSWLSGLMGGQKSPNIAIDIGSQVIKMIAVRRQKGQMPLVRHVQMEVAPEELNEGGLGDPAALGEIFRGMHRLLGVRERQVAFAIPYASTYRHTVLLPANLKKEDLDVQAEKSAHDILPISLDEAYWDYDVIGPSSNVGQNEVLLVAARRDLVDERLAALEAANLNPVHVDVDLYCLERLYRKLSSRLPVSEVVGLLDLGGRGFRLHVFYQNQAVYSRENNFGGAALVTDFARHYSMSQGQALGLILEHHGPLGWEKEVLAPWMENLAAEVAHELQMFSAASAYPALSMLWLCGGGALLKGVTQAIGAETGVETREFNPFRLAEQPRAESSSILGMGSALAVAYGALLAEKQ